MLAPNGRRAKIGVLPVAPSNSCSFSELLAASSQGGALALAAALRPLRGFLCWMGGERVRRADGGAHPFAGLAARRLARTLHRPILPILLLTCPTSYRSYRRAEGGAHPFAGLAARRLARTPRPRPILPILLLTDPTGVRRGVRTPSQGSHARASRTPTIIPILLLTCYLSYFLPILSA